MNLHKALALLALCVPLSGAAQPASRPGGRFFERLREAEEKLRGPAARPAVRRRVPRPPAGKRRPAVAARPGRRRVERGTSAGRAHWSFRRARTRVFRGFRTADVSYSLRPRRRGATSPGSTGDLILIAEPENVPVFFYPKGGSQLPGVTTAVMRSCKPQRLYVLAFAPEIRGRAQTWVPVRAGQITTVRFVFAPERR
jgi:hypothetical protein